MIKVGNTALQTDLDNLQTRVETFVRKTITFDGAAGTGAVGAVPIFTTTGEVLIKSIVPICGTDLTEGGATATLALGVTGSVSLFVAATTATTIDAGEFWMSTTATAAGMAVPAACKDIAITENIIGTVAAQAVATGAITFNVIYLPLSSDGALA